MERDKNFVVCLHFGDLKAGEQPPAVAVYELDASGRPVRKLGRAEKDQLEVQAAWSKLGVVALGPDVDDPKSLPRESLIPYRLESTVPLWREHGIMIGRPIWEGFLFEIVCVSGEAKKCRPWWWHRIDVLDTRIGFELTRLTPARAALEDLSLRPIFPAHCVPLCDGIVEIYERVCCCRHWHWRDIFDKLREILQVIPIPLPDPIPDPDPGPWPGPRPGPDPAPFQPRDLGQLAAMREAHHPTRSGERRGLAKQAAQVRRRLARAPAPSADMPGERLYADYVALSRMAPAQAEQYVLAHPYLIGLICHCWQRKIGETPLQPGGRFDFCYRRLSTLILRGWCSISFAFKVRQYINGSWVTVYDGVASHDWFPRGESAELHSWDWRARVCGSDGGDPPPSDGPLPFVMLEYVGSAGTRHRKFPNQTAVSTVAALAADSGTYDTGYAPDCPWGSSLGLRLWVSPEMQPLAKYYRLSAVPVNDSGAAVGSPTILDAPVSWDRWVQVGGNWVTTSEQLSANPADVGGLIGLIRIPYWNGGNYWLSSQFHQVWNTALFAHGKYLLLIELFDAAAGPIKPNSAPPTDPGSAQPFQLRRWRFGDPTATDNVPFANAAHVFWVDNSPVEGDIVDFRKDGVPNTEECQFITGPAGTLVSVGFRAYHDRGVANPANTFMMSYSLTWTRGLNGPSGSFAGGTADVGEPPGGPAASGGVTVGQLLGPWPGFPSSHSKCTFSVHLAVYAKHFTGGGRISGYDYHESASFAASLP